MPPLANVNLLLGDNGAGKTTVLRAIALVILARLRDSGFVPYHLVRYASNRAHVYANLVLESVDFVALTRPPADYSSGFCIIRKEDIEEVSVENKEVLHSGAWDGLYLDDSPAFLVLGYGASRFIQEASEPVPTQRKRRLLRYQRVAGLFEDHLGLAPIGSWLPDVMRQHRNRFREVVDLFNELLPEGATFTGKTDQGEFLFKYRGTPVPLGALSDGYRAYIGWISDLFYNISLVTPRNKRLRDARGVILVDEIDLHLHPEWQRVVVPTVARTLPNLQFVFTTHSPIVAGTLSAQNIFVLEMDGSGASTIRQLEEPIHGLNADQILVSPYFGLDTTRAPGTVTKLRDLSRKAMAGDSRAAVAFLNSITLGADPSPGKVKKKSARKSGRRPSRIRTK